MITYSGVHQRMARKFGHARSKSCTKCGVRARHWAYDGTDPNELRSPVGPYSLDPERYRPLCTECHEKDKE